MFLDAIAVESVVILFAITAIGVLHGDLIGFCFHAILIVAIPAPPLLVGVTGNSGMWTGMAMDAQSCLGINLVTRLTATALFAPYRSGVFGRNGVILDFTRPIVV